MHSHMIEDLCINRDAAIELKQAGWTKKTIFVWSHAKNDPFTWVVRPYVPLKADVIFPAPTAVEIAEQLPDDIDIERSKGMYRATVRIPANAKYERTVEITRFETLQIALAHLWLQINKPGSSKETHIHD